MKKFACFFLTLTITTSALTQKECPEYAKLMDQAKNFSAHRDYRKALYKYNSAKTCAPSKRLEIDEQINVLFERIENEKIKAEAAQIKMKNAMLKAARLEIEKNNSDSSHVVEMFKNKNGDWIKKMTPKQQNEMFGYVYRLSGAGRSTESDSLASSLNLLYDAKEYDNDYVFYNDTDSSIIKTTKFPENQSTPLPYFRARARDIAYFKGLLRLDQSKNLLPSYFKDKYNGLISSFYSSLAVHKKNLIQNYWMPDTLIELPTYLFATKCADNDNFLYTYKNTADYNKIDIRYLNLSLSSFQFTKDSTLPLSDTGNFYNILNASANYVYNIGKYVNYSLKKSLTEFDVVKYAEPVVIKLMDNNGNEILNFNKDSLEGFIFSPDANFVATWKSRFELLIYNTKTKQQLTLPNTTSVPTVTFSANSKTIAYFNRITKLIYFSNKEGNIINQIPSYISGITDITNIDFTGNDKFLKINNVDSVCLFDIAEKKIIFRFKKSFVDDIIADPSGKYFLINCITTYNSSDGKPHNSHLAILTDINLNIKVKLYSDCNDYFFTASGDFIIGYDKTSIMRWDVNNTIKNEKHFQSSIGYSELIDNNCLPYGQFIDIEDADLIESGARKFKNMAEEEKTDPMLKGLYYRQARALFDRLAYGNAKGIRKQNIPIFYDWYNWIDNKLMTRNFRDQFIREQAAVKIFEDLVNSPDSVYPQQLHYAANGYWLLSKLYDSLGAYNNDYLDNIKKELALRQKVFNKNPDDDDNIYFYVNAIKRLANVSDSVGIMNITNKQYADRLNLFRNEEIFLSEKLKLLPDSFSVKLYYINALAQLGASYLYVYVNRPKEYPNALDSALLFADKGLALAPSNKYDYARFLIVKARVYLLKENEAEKAKSLFQTVLNKYPEFPKESMLRLLQYLKDAGAKDNKNILNIEEFLRQQQP